MGEEQMEQQSKKICRLCRCEDSEEELIAPCGCDGENKWVHRSCINAYRIFYNDPVAFGKCLICGVDYTFKHVREHSLWWLMTKMIFKLIFQIMTLFVSLIALFYVCGIIPYAIDVSVYPFLTKDSESYWFTSPDFYWITLVYGAAFCLFCLGLWSIAGLFKRCFCKAEFDEELSYHDTQRIGACCSLTLCCMPFIYKQSFLYRWGCCQCCDCCPNTCINCYDCDCLTCLLCCDCCTDCCYVTPYHHHMWFWHPHYHFYRTPVYAGSSNCCACGGCDCGGCGGCDIGGGNGGDAGKLILLIIAIIVIIIICVGAIVGTISFFVFVGYLIKINFDYIKKQAESETYVIDNWDESIHPMPVQNPPGMDIPQASYDVYQQPQQQVFNGNETYAPLIDPTADENDHVPPMGNFYQPQGYIPQDGSY